MAEYQPDLWGDYPDPPCQRHSPTSRAAAEAALPRAGTQRALVLDWLSGRGDNGGTDEEGIDATGIVPSAYRPRRVELYVAGLVKDSGRTRTVRSGLRAVVWVATLFDTGKESDPCSWTFSPA